MRQLRYTSIVMLLCAATASRALAAQDNQAKPEARAFVFPTCFVSSQVNQGQLNKMAALDLASAFIGSAVSTGYSALTSALKSAGDPKVDDQKFTNAKFYFYEANKEKAEAGAEVKTSPRMGCVLLVHGTFSSAESPVVQSYSVGESCLDTCKNGTPDCEKCLQKNHINVEKLNLLFEARVLFSEDQSAITYEPRYFQVRDWLQEGRKDRTHSYVVTLSLAGPGAKTEDDNVQSTAVLDLGKREKGRVYTTTELPGSSGWLSGGLGLTDLDKQRIKDLSDSKQNPAQELHPSVVFASISESAEGSAFAKNLATLLDAAKDKATSAITAVADPNTTIKNRQTAASDLETARKAEETSFDAFLDKEIALETAEAGSPKPTSTQDAKLKFELAAAERAWCRDYNALKSQKAAPDRSQSADCAK